jgi:hypothetical protein
MWGQDTDQVIGAVSVLLENHYGVDILDEWALTPAMDSFPMIVAPERHEMSQDMVNALKKYVENGGKLIISGYESYKRFGSEFLGVTEGKVEDDKAYHVSAGKDTVTLYSKKWHLTEAVSAKGFGTVGKTPLVDDMLLPNNAYFVNKRGKGAVAYIPANVFKDWHFNRPPELRIFINEVVRRLVPKFNIEVMAPLCIDAVLRRKGKSTILNFINRSSGVPNYPQNGFIDEIPLMGPIEVTMKSDKKPVSVTLPLSKVKPQWNWKKGEVKILVPCVHIHEVLVVQ